VNEEIALKILKSSNFVLEDALATVKRNKISYRSLFEIRPKTKENPYDKQYK